MSDSGKKQFLEKIIPSVTEHCLCPMSSKSLTVEFRLNQKMFGLKKPNESALVKHVCVATVTAINEFLCMKKLVGVAHRICALV